VWRKTLLTSTVVTTLAVAARSSKDQASIHCETNFRADTTADDTAGHTSLTRRRDGFASRSMALVAASTFPYTGR
jgi:hypothetical protein